MRFTPTKSWYNSVERKRQPSGSLLEKNMCPYDARSLSFFDNRFKSLMEKNSENLFNLGDIQQANNVT